MPSTLRFALALALTSFAAAPVHGQLYLANANADSILVFDPAVGGAQPPLQEVTATVNPIDLLSAVAVDPFRGEIFARLGIRTFSPTLVGADLAYNELMRAAEAAPPGGREATHGAGR